MTRPSPYVQWEHRLRQDRERRLKRAAQQRERDSGPYLRRMWPFTRTLLWMFAFSASYGTIRLLAIVYGPC